MDPTSEAALGILPGTTGNVDPSSAAPIAGATGIVMGTGTAQHGVTPATQGGNGMMGAVTYVWDWLNTPFRSPMAPTDIWLLVGVVLVSIILWNLILYHIRIASE